MGWGFEGNFLPVVCTLNHLIRFSSKFSVMFSDRFVHPHVLPIPSKPSPTSTLCIFCPLKIENSCFLEINFFSQVLVIARVYCIVMDFDIYSEKCMGNNNKCFLPTKSTNLKLYERINVLLEFFVTLP